MNADALTYRDVAVILQINTNGHPETADGFTKKTVGSMFGWTFTPQEILVLERDGVEVLTIPWPDGLTLDQALRAWAKTVQG